MKYPMWVHRVDAQVTVAIRRFTNRAAILFKICPVAVPSHIKSPLLLIAIWMLVREWHGASNNLWFTMTTIVMFPLLSGFVMAVILLVAQINSGVEDAHYQEYRLGDGHAAWGFTIMVIVTIGLCQLLVSTYSLSITLMAINLPVSFAWHQFIIRKPDDNDDRPRQHKKEKKTEMGSVWARIAGVLQPQV